MPSKLELTGNLAANWKKFHRAWNNYEIAARLKDPENPAINKSLRTATLLTCIGSDALDVYQGLEFDSEDDKQEIDIATPTLQCDASMHGLRACLMQDGHPVAYASRSLTPTEVQYAQIEKELLAIVFTMEKFETYLYGRKVLVESDHKPLAAIFKKSLLNAPKRLQRMLLRLQRYEFEVSYKRGTSLLLADPLSRAYVLRKEATEDQEDVLTVSKTRSPTEIEAEQVNMLQYFPVKDETFCQIQHLTQEDAILKTLAGVITHGWSDSKLRIPPEVQDYFPFKEELTLQNGVIFKGDRVVIPFQMRADLKRKLHASHLGVQACQRRAREAFYWPGMYKECVSKCEVCNTYHQGQEREPLISHPVPSRTWQVLAVDLFELQGQDYLVTTYYYSNFFEVDKLVRKTSKEVIEKLKPHMARHGIPDKIVSDNGPQFSSQESKVFKDCYEFDHVTSFPTYPQSNGMAENAVKTAQRIMLKALEAGSDPYLGFLDFRNTPTEGLGTSPAQRLFGRRTKTLLPTAGRLLTQPEFDTTSQPLHAQKTNNLSITTRALKNSGHLNPGAPFVSIHPNIVINGPKQRLTNKLAYAHTKLLVTTEGCIAGTADTCVSQLKFQNNHLLTLRFQARILVLCL